MKLLLRLWGHLSGKRKKQIIALMIFIVVTSVTEVISIGALIPFLGILTAPEKIFASSFFQPFISYFSIESPGKLVLPITILFIVAAILSGLTRLALLWGTSRLSYAIGTDLGIDIYRRTLYQPYQTHVMRNSSEVITGILMKSKRLIGSVIMPTLQITSSLCIILSVLAFLIQLNPLLMSITFFSFGFIYLSLAFLIRKRLSGIGNLEAKENSSVLKLLQDGFGGIRDVLLNGNQEFFTNLFKKTETRLRHASSKAAFLSSSPKFIFESIGMILIAILAYQSIHGSVGLEASLPILGSLAMSAQRLLPILQQSYQGWVNFRVTKPTLKDVLEFLDQPLPEYADQANLTPLPFTKKIELRNVSFRYAGSNAQILENINLEIPLGSRIGIVGSTGSGKSTLMDIIMGLLEPASGELLVDGQRVSAGNARNWQTNIANVPQAIFLTDNSLTENIAFGIPREKINPERIRWAAQQAQIASHIESLEKGYDTMVGERGVRLSGGQRQRIGIARALYKQASVITFDEATSALDSETEQAVINAIDNLGKELTLLIVAHRLSTIKNCDLIIKLKDGKIEKTGKFDEIFLAPA